ncbi:MAG: hypothetical protein EOO38_20580, partial [Cytophagaceae bacterium]
MPENQLTPLVRRLKSVANLLERSQSTLLSLHYRIVRYDAGNELYKAGTVDPPCFILLEGCATRFKLRSDGSRAIVAVELMGDIIKALNERYKTPIQTEIGESDTIRNFFLRDVDSLHVLIPWGWFFLRTFYIKDGTKEQPPIMQRLSEGNDVMLVTLEAAFQFRQANVETYDLDPESLEDGILKPGHGNDVLPHFWTSGHNVVSSVRSLVDVGRNLAVSNYEEGYQEGLSQKIGKDNPRLVKIGCQTHVERFQWALEQSDEKTREMGRSLRTEWNVNVRPNHIFGLTEIGL